MSLRPELPDSKQIVFDWSVVVSTAASLPVALCGQLSAAIPPLGRVPVLTGQSSRSCRAVVSRYEVRQSNHKPVQAIFRGLHAGSVRLGQSYHSGQIKQEWSHLRLRRSPWPRMQPDQCGQSSSGSCPLSLVSVPQAGRITAAMPALSRVCVHASSGSCPGRYTRGPCCVHPG